ncbi:discoidin domain-containing protein [Carboxylicivirga mesophila]|uniref:Discoidin domain-containing protein n=1 Tax=Carboxylicivirga mesophila TaxID=1166478 RepID=A0ABS5K7Z7_9BACT|nr:discoidin domain-containing protein [Carboxylicivirga mesophila]MBS2211125.1 discoidin domain-containing protein [Carboxylicivirga mesophila]
MKTFTYLLSVVVMMVLMACSSDTPQPQPEPENPEEPVSYNYTSSAKYNLNVVYFVPNDISERQEWHRRLSEILLNGQDFILKHMKAYGFGDKTVHLKVDEEHARVKITLVNGKYATSHYPSEGGGTKIIEELEAYFASHPDEKDSDHTLVLIPVDNPDPGQRDIPYYGYGRYCFALDYNEMDVAYLKDEDERGQRATTYIGGLLHELGHALNLPHNKQTVSADKNPEQGTALMGSGNYTYGKYPTYLTRASCAILNNCQVVSTDESTNFYSEVSLKVTDIQAKYENSELKVSGSIECDVPVNQVCFYNDPATDNADYDAVSWSVALDGGNSFSVNMPVSELFQRGNTPYVLRLRFCHQNGAISTYSYAYTFKDDNLLIEFGDKDYLDRQGWSMVDFSSEEAGEQATNVLDGDHSTFWHSRWSTNAASYPHYLTIDMGQSQTINGFTFVQRDGMRKVKDIEILLSNDMENWESQGSFVLKNINTAHHIELNQPGTYRYFKVIAKSAFDGQQFAAMAEIMCF